MSKWKKRRKENGWINGQLVFISMWIIHTVFLLLLLGILAPYSHHSLNLIQLVCIVKVPWLGKECWKRSIRARTATLTSLLKRQSERVNRILDVNARLYTISISLAMSMAWNLRNVNRKWWMQFSLGLAVFIYLVWLFIVQSFFSGFLSVFITHCLPFKFLGNFSLENMPYYVAKNHDKNRTPNIIIDYWFFLYCNAFERTILKWTMNIQ